MLYLTCTMIYSVDLAHYGVSQIAVFRTDLSNKDNEHEQSENGFDIYSSVGDNCIYCKCLLDRWLIENADTYSSNADVCKTKWTGMYAFS